MTWAGTGGLADLPEVATRDTFGAGHVVTYAPPGGSATALDPPPVFDSAYEVVDLVGDVPVSATAPVVDVRTADLPGGVEAVQGGVFVIDGVSYEVVDKQHSGQRLSIKYRLVKT